MANLLTDFKNGLGYIYVTDPNGTNILSSILNTKEGGLMAQKLAVTSAPLCGNISSNGKIVFSGVPNDVTSITINGVSVLTGTIIGGAMTLAQIAAAVRDNINTTLSVPKYYATNGGSAGETVFISSDASTGSASNNFVIAVSTVGGLIATITNMSGGVDNSAIVDTSTGSRFFLNANYDVNAVSGAGTAEEDSLTNSVEITNYLVHRGYNSSLQTFFGIVNNSNNNFLLTRDASITNIVIDTDGGATNTLKSITINNALSSINYSENDIIIIRGNDPSRVTTIKSYSSGNDNIKLANNVDWVSANKDTVLMLQWHNGAAPNWYEIGRTPNLDLTVANMRIKGIAMPVQGVNLTSLPTSGTIDIEAGVDKGTQVYYGTVSLIGSVVIGPKVIPTIPYLDGDEIWVDYRALATVGVNTVTIFGITLTTTQALEGRIIIKSKYKLSNTTWYSSLFYRPNGKDLVDKTYVDSTFELSLGNPSSDGYFVVGNTDGSRSWIPAITTVSLYAGLTPPNISIAGGENLASDSVILASAPAPFTVAKNEFLLSPFDANTGRFTFKEAGKYNVSLWTQMTSPANPDAWGSGYVWIGFVYGTDIYGGAYMNIPNATQTKVHIICTRLNIIITDTDVTNGTFLDFKILNKSAINYVQNILDVAILSVQKTL